MKVEFVCPSCRETISAPASLEGESSSCPKCKADVDRWPAPVRRPVPTGPATPPTAAPAVVHIVPPPVEPAVWYYSANGVRRGPVTASQLKALVESAVLRANDLLWREGLPGWVEAGTIPGLFPALPMPVPVPVPVPAYPPPQPAEGNEAPRASHDGRPIHVTVTQVVERQKERRPRRRRGYRCPDCDSPARPIYRQQVSQAGWIVFVLLLFFTVIFCFIGLLMTEEVAYCPDCGTRL